MKLDIKGLEDMLERIKKAGGKIEQATEKALKESAKPFYDDLQAGIQAHYKTGDTELSLRSTNVEWNGNVASLKVGFDMNRGGLPALILEYGSPKQPARPFIRPAITRNKPKAKKIQQKVLGDILKELEK